MLRKKIYIPLFVIMSSILLFSCGEDGTLNIPTADERKEAVRDSLQMLLTAPQFGWRIDYQPDEDFGSFIMLLTFDEGGNVNIRSDISNNDGEFLDHTVSYRIDNGIGTELIFETYSVFSFLNEVAGGEFEFLFLEATDDNLIFQSKSDLVNPTVITFQPAGEFDEGLLSNEITDNMAKTLFQDAGLIGNQLFYQLYLTERDISIFMVFDLDSRAVKVLNAGVGFTSTEINTTGLTTPISETFNFSVQGDKIVFSSALSFNLNGESVLISEFSLSNFQESTESLCAGQEIPAGTFDGQIGNENVIFKSSVYSARTNFGPISDGIYSVSTFGLIDNTDTTIEDRILLEFPEAVGFQFYFELQGQTSTFNEVGFILIDNNNNPTWYLRTIDTPILNGNIMDLNLTSTTSGTSTAAQEQALLDLTDEVFAGGQVYVLEFAGIDDFFELYNPCNNYKIFLNK